MKLLDASKIYTDSIWYRLRKFTFDGEPTLMPLVREGEFLWGWYDNNLRGLEVDGIISRMFHSSVDDDGIQYEEISMASNAMICYRYDSLPNCKPDADDFCECFPFEYKPIFYTHGAEMCDRCWLDYGRQHTIEMCGRRDHIIDQEVRSG